MQLKIVDRLVIPTILPEKADYKTLVLKNDIVEKVKISQKEMEAISFETVQGGFKWDQEKEKPLEVEFTELEHQVIKDSLMEKDKGKALADNMLGLYKLFCL